MTNRLLLVEPSATMRYVLEKHAESLGFTVETTQSYSEAGELLEQQYQQFGAEFAGLLFGWPSTAQEPAAALAHQLEQAEYKDLPVVVMSTDMRAETRAWVAGRDNTAVLSWKEYQGLESLLQRLIDVAPDEGDAFSAKFDNSDIHLLIVDDSATIRYSLRDLFQMQGYRVTLASTQEEAMRVAVKTSFDIAILDFYLAETTGDLLCRELMKNEDAGEVVCTILTGTYSDHIIKRSLRAGAVECMFKNESSELLLSRIDAISRFVRQRRALINDSHLLENVIESVAGAVLLIDTDHRIIYISKSGLEELNLDSATSLVGQPSETLLEIDGPQAAGEQLHTATWRLPDGDTIEIDYEHRFIEDTGRSLIRFAQKKMGLKSAASTDATPELVPEPVSETALIEQLGLELSSDLFLKQMMDYQRDAQSLRVSLLVLEVFTQDEAGELLPISANEQLEVRVRESLEAIYKRPAHVAGLQASRYGFLLRHREEAQAYLLVRKIMQLCLEIGADDLLSDGNRLVCSGSLLSLIDNAQQPTRILLQHAFKGLDLVNSRGVNQALLLDLRRMLSVYPQQSNSKD